MLVYFVKNNISRRCSKKFFKFFWKYKELLFFFNFNKLINDFPSRIKKNYMFYF